MNKTRKIKELLGTVLSEKEFKYTRLENGIIWTFERTVESVKQKVYVQQHTRLDKEYKLMMWSSAKGQGMCEIGDILPEYEGKEYWQAQTDEEFEEILVFFSKFIKEKGFDVDDFDALGPALEAGSAKAVNIVLMGHFAACTDIPKEKWMAALQKVINPKFMEMNVKAFETGYGK